MHLFNELFAECELASLTCSSDMLTIHSSRPSDDALFGPVWKIPVYPASNPAE
jgi:hypothetical protein